MRQVEAVIIGLLIVWFIATGRARKVKGVLDGSYTAA